jgi:glycosyltransferase involved in cell wall biosynthesis
VGSSAPRELSVVIASHNRRELLRRCLASLERQTQDPASFEVIVAADGCSDDSAEMVEGLQTNLEIRLLRLDKGGKSAALNAGIEAARGSVCLFLDDDIVASPELVAEHVAAHKEDPRTIGVGALEQRPPQARDWYAHAFAAAWKVHYDEFETKPPSWSDCYGGNLSAPRSALVEVGGFATDLPSAEDIELGYRLWRAGCVPRYLSAARGVHDDQKPGRRMLEDRQRYAATYLEVAELHPAALPEMLGKFSAPDDRLVGLRRLLIALRIPPTALAALGGLIPGRGRQMVWFHFVTKLAFWGALRGQVGRHRWKQLAS